MLPFISVIVITKNNAKTVENCIVSLLNQTYPKENYEIIFVDGYSIDGTDKVIKKYSRDHSFLKLYYENYGTMGYARNLGISKSRGDIIAFTDGDAVLPKDWVERIVKAFNNVQLVAVGGLDVIVSSDESGSIIDSWRRLRKAKGVKAIPCIKTVNFAIRRDAVLSCGGFDPTLNHLDEAELLARLYSKTKAGNVFYDPEIIVYHKRPQSTKMGRRIKKVFKKSVVATSVLMRRYMMKVAIENPISPLATSFYLILACIVTIPLFLFSIATGLFTSILMFTLLLYLVILSIYLVHMFLKTRKVTLFIPLILTTDCVVRFAGTFFGLIKWFRDFVYARMHAWLDKNVQRIKSSSEGLIEDVKSND